MSLSIDLALLVAFLFGVGMARTMGESAVWQQMDEQKKEQDNG